MSLIRKFITTAELNEIIEQQADENYEDRIYDEFDFVAPLDAKWEKGDLTWKGYDIYMPVCPDGTPITEYPLAIAVTSGEARLLTAEEITEYLSKRNF